MLVAHQLSHEKATALHGNRYANYVAALLEIQITYLHSSGCDVFDGPITIWNRVGLIDQNSVVRGED